MKNTIHLLTAILILCLCVIHALTTETLTALVAYPTICSLCIYLECVYFDTKGKEENK